MGSAKHNKKVLDEAQLEGNSVMISRTLPPIVHRYYKSMMTAGFTSEQAMTFTYALHERLLTIAVGPKSHK